MIRALGMLGLGMLCASPWAIAGEATDCQAPAALVAAQAQWASKFSLALEGCATQPDPTAATPPSPAGPTPAAAAPSSRPATTSRPAEELQLYDGTASRLLTIDPPALVSLSQANVSVPRQAGTSRRVLGIAPEVQRVARAYDIDPLLLHAIAHVESRHNPQAQSPAGALGLMQVMPATARRFGIDNPTSALLDPTVSLEVGSAYLKSLQARFGNNLALVLAAYNAGEGSVERHGRQVPPYAETRSYVQQVLAEYRTLRASLATVAIR